MNPDLLKILCCPETHQGLREADPALLQRINDRIASGSVKNRAGIVVTERAEGGLIRQDGAFVYPIRKGIPVMLIDEAIPLGAI